MDQGSELHSNGKVLHGGDEAGVVVIGDPCGGPVSDRDPQPLPAELPRRPSTSAHRLPLLARARSRHPPARGPTREQPPSARSTTSGAMQIKSSVEGPCRAGRGSFDRRTPSDRCSWQQCLHQEVSLQPVKSLRVTGQGIAGGRLRAPFGRPVQNRWRADAGVLRDGAHHVTTWEPALVSAT